MNVLTYNPDALTKYTVIPLGRACECQATRIEFAVSSWLSRFPGGEIALYIKDPNGEMYLGDVRTADGVASWVLRESDTQVPGYGSLELALIGANGEKKLSAVATTKLEASLVESETDAEYMQPWIERAAEIQAATQTAARAAATHAAVASTGASNAVEAQEAAEAARDAAEAAQEAAEGAAQGAEESAKAAGTAADAAAGHAADAADSAQGADAAERAAQEAAQAAEDNANEAYMSAEEALTHSQAAQKAAANAAQEAAEGVRQSIAADAEAAQQAAERAETSAKDAQDVLASIPEDYTALAEQVAQNKQDILTKAPAIYEAASGALVTVEDAAALPALSIVSAINPAQPGTGDPSPDNVRPIPGFDVVTLTRTGKNLLGFGDFEVVGGAYTDSCVQGVFTRTVTTQHTTSSCLHGNAMSSIKNAHLKAGTYVFTLTCSSGIKFASPYAEVTLVDGTIVQLESGKTTTIAMDGTITGIKQTNTQYNTGDIITFTMQLEAGEVATDYEPYSGATRTAILPETVYAGTLDWTTGLLTVTHFAQTYDGTEAWNDPGNGMSYTLPNSVPGEAMVDNEAFYHLCSHYKPVKYRTPDAQADMSCYTLNGHTLCIKDTSAGTLEGLKTSLAAQAAAGTPMTIAWQLKPASYVTHQLTPQQLDMLKGCNAVRSDAGDTSVVYVADTKMYIDNRLAAIAAANLNV